MQDFRKLKVWEKSHRFSIDVYNATSAFPKEEIYGLTSQIRRAAVSISANIAEGCGRGSDADFKRFLHIAFGSASEAECLLELSKDLNFIDNEHVAMLLGNIEEIKKMLASLINSVSK